jgi:hypothetical protein
MIYSFLESRGGKFNAVTFFGLQYYLMKYFAGVVVNEQFIKKARRRFRAHFGNDALFNEAGWLRLIEKHGGKLPIRIKAARRNNCSDRQRTDDNREHRRGIRLDHELPRDLALDGVVPVDRGDAEP